MDRLYFSEMYITEHHADLRREAAEAHMIKLAAKATGERTHSAYPITSARLAMGYLRRWLWQPREVTDLAGLS